MSILFSDYEEAGLHQLISKLNQEYYEVLGRLCRTASDAASKLLGEHQHTSTNLYASLSSKLVEHLEELVSLRQQLLVPYIKDLSTKKDQGHDCSNCAGGCGIQHKSQVLTLKDTHKHIKEILYRLHTVALPLYAEVPYPKTYCALRRDIVTIDTLLTKLFYLEEANLVPSVLEAQKLINV